MKLNVCVFSFFVLLFLSLTMMVTGLLFLVEVSVVMVEWEFFLGEMFFIILLDWMSLLFLGFVSFISSMVLLYSNWYMGSDENLIRFVIIVLLFVFSMGMMILSPNLVSILLGWDGLGLVSYCLVIYYQNFRSNSAGMLTALSNRVGDVALLLGIALMFNMGGWNFMYYFELYCSDGVFWIIMFLVMLAGMTKSAQIPFSAWLPAAMAAPTPVSALVHSSTLVTAGVYLLIRFSPLLEGVMWSDCLLFFSSLTMFMSGLGANFECDLKKIIALSTLSQLGLMMVCLSLGLSMISFFHLLTHALFKSLLFLCAGVVIHNLVDCQDIRMMGGLSKLIPFTMVCFNVSNLALCGMPFLAGFYSKDLILELLGGGVLSVFSFVLLMFSTGLTVSYTLRLLFISVSIYGEQAKVSSMNESSLYLNVSMASLVFMSIFGGSMLMWMIFPSPHMICLSFFLKMSALFCIMFGMWLSITLKFFDLSLYVVWVSGVVSYFGSMWFMPLISSGSGKGLMFYGDKFMKVGEMGWLEELEGKFVFSYFMIKFTLFIQWIQNNLISVFTFSFFFWSLIIFLS
uniref:NADH-ubiquinone oxidoreductase chain 5 n=1 Tax=Octostigma sinensis TaxID=211997 RepID=U3KTI4_9HEXA|nr:NADH dehydrogenase subunit 5 [Octostigma sinensis]AEV44841.1 NADH dehydrogenase subunit 5 [Octostigma sinensis]